MEVIKSGSAFVTFRNQNAYSTVETNASIMRTPLGYFFEVCGKVTAKPHLADELTYEFFLYSRKIEQYDVDFFSPIEKFAENALVWFLSAARLFLVGQDGVSFVLSFFDIHLPEDDSNSDISVLERLAFAGEAARAIELFLRPFRQSKDSIASALDLFVTPFIELNREYDEFSLKEASK